MRPDARHTTLEIALQTSVESCRHERADRVVERGLVEAEAARRALEARPQEPDELGPGGVELGSRLGNGPCPRLDRVAGRNAGHGSSQRFVSLSKSAPVLPRKRSAGG